ncbi:group 1 glycosyl transferase [Haloferax elongans ATCC BAA-1513]|uniref:Group 1 glycosyl transferase n=1 Tax=Haloferax elongans ATCC BAA-1513 TaxID=1230453 RepID=M0HB60_HALEO|nr:glycosyltransferase [Haloferax elongans]ELZ81725.1 group 1 glycosyl transferase [Haloferax elongans ATCC BAA-1513]
MKILHVCGSFPPAYAYGGPPRSIQHLTAALADLGHEVTVVTTDAKDEASRVEINNNPTWSDGVEVYRFRNLSNKLSWKNIQIPPKMMLYLLRNCSDYDVVHSHEFRSPPSVFAHFASTVAGIPHVHQPRGSMPRYELSHLKLAFDRVIGEQMITAVDQLVASSESEGSLYDDIFPSINTDKVAKVPNGISTEVYQDLPEQGRFKHSNNIDSREKVILFLSRLHPRKGGDLLIDAVSQLERENIRLVFVGPDEGAQSQWKSYAERKGIQAQTKFIGPLYDTDKLEAYVDADLFVLPSKDRYESFGNVVIEAMACGTPVIATNVCGVSEWLNHPGCQVSKPDVNDLCQSIRNHLDGKSPDESSVKQYIQENFSWSSVAKETEKIYEKLIQ